MRDLLFLLLFVTFIFPFALTARAAQKAASWQCWVQETDGGSYAYIQVSKDQNFVSKPLFVKAASMDEVKSACRLELQKWQNKEAKPITSGVVDLSVPVSPEPAPVSPTQDELDRAAFIGRVELARKLAVVVPADDKELADLRTQIATDLKAHSEWKDSL